MRALLGKDDWKQLEASFDLPSSTGLRVNTLKLSGAEFRKLSQWPLAPVPWCDSGYVLEPAGAGESCSASSRADRLEPQRAGPERPGLHPFHAAGLYYLQDPSAMAVAEALAPRPGELVLDMAAAPGGKSSHLAALLGDSGILVANDPHGGRARELSRNLERFGAPRALVTSAEAPVLAQQWGAIFDAVLLDAPCSGEGMFRKNPEACRHWSPEAVAACARRQEALLPLAAKLVRPGGRLVYSTCTLGPAENEEVVTRFLAGHPEWKLVDPQLARVGSGRPDWSGDGRIAELHKTVRLWPHRQVGEGHFLALLSNGEATTRVTGPAADGSRARLSGRRRRSTEGSLPATARDSERAAALWRSFVAENLSSEPLAGQELRLERDGLYAVPGGSPATDGIPTLRPGLWLGTVVRGRFEPSHALALSLRREQARDSVDLQPDGAEVEAYLAGAELERSGPDGWTLVCIAGYPLGWGRRGRGIVKNRYPKGLRRR